MRILQHIKPFHCLVRPDNGIIIFLLHADGNLTQNTNDCSLFFCKWLLIVRLTSEIKLLTTFEVPPLPILSGSHYAFSRTSEMQQQHIRRSSLHNDRFDVVYAFFLEHIPISLINVFSHAFLSHLILVGNFDFAILETYTNNMVVNSEYNN